MSLETSNMRGEINNPDLSPSSSTSTRCWYYAEKLAEKVKLVVTFPFIQLAKAIEFIGRLLWCFGSNSDNGRDISPITSPQAEPEEESSSSESSSSKPEDFKDKTDSSQMTTDPTIRKKVLGSLRNTKKIKNPITNPGNITVSPEKKASLDLIGLGVGSKVVENKAKEVEQQKKPLRNSLLVEENKFNKPANHPAQQQEASESFEQQQILPNPQEAIKTLKEEMKESNPVENRTKTVYTQGPFSVANLAKTVCNQQSSSIGNPDKTDYEAPKPNHLPTGLHRYESAGSPEYVEIEVDSDVELDNE